VDNEFVVPSIGILGQTAHLFDGDGALELFTLDVAQLGGRQQQITLLFHSKSVVFANSS